MRGNISWRAVLVLSVAVAILGLAGSAAWAAVPVTIVNAGFEDPNLADGVWQSAIPGWTEGWYDLGAADPTAWVVGGAGGIIDVSTAEYTSGLAPEGENVAWIEAYAGYDCGINQVLLGRTSALQADATYVLSATVGNPALYNATIGAGPTADYRIELLAGGVVLQSATGPSPADDLSFTTASLTYNSGAAPAQLGQQLEIRLIAVDDVRDLGYEVDFDAVSLNATYAHPISDPDGSYTVIIGTGSLSLDGSGSLPSDGSTISAYQWDLNNDGTYGDVTGDLPSAISYADLTGTWGMAPGANIVGLKVIDGTTAEEVIASTIVTLANATATYIGDNNSKNDRWNLTTSWDTGVVPSGPIDVVLPGGKNVCVWSNSTPTYTGNLTIGSNTTLQIGWTSVYLQSYNALGTPGSTTIYMYEGSTINMRMGGSPSIPAIQLMGNALIKIGESTQPSASPTFGQGINGPYTLTLMGKDGSKAYLTHANSFGELVTNCNFGNRFIVYANVADSLGGDVTILPYNTDNSSALLYVNASDAMADTAALTLNGKGWNGSAGAPAPAGSYTRLVMNSGATDTIGKLFIDGVQQPAGTYSAASATWLAGTGALTVGEAPLYWDLNDANAGAGGATPSGTWDAANTYWNTDSTGGAGGTVDAWTAGKVAYFAAGTDASGTYDVTVSGTQDIGGLSFGQGNVTLSGGALQMTADTPVSVASGATATIATTISDDGNSWQLSKSGDGTLVLSGTNTYTGITAVGGGILSVSSLANANSPSSIGQYPTAGAGGLVLGGGTLQYTGGSTTVNRGFTLMGDTTIDISSDDTALALGACSSDSTYTLTVTGGSGSSLSIGAVTLLGGMTLNPTTASLTVASVKVDCVYGWGVGYLTLDGTASGNAITGAITKANSGNIYLVKSNTGTWTLSGTNTYTGTTTVKAGTLIADANALSNANGAFGKATSDVNLGVANGNVDASILIGGPYTVGRIIRNATQDNTDIGTRVLTLGGSTADESTFSGKIFLGTSGRTSMGVTLTAVAGGKVTFSGVIQETGGTRTQDEIDAATALDSVTKVGLGTVVLSNDNTYLGATVVNEGTLLVNNTSGSGTGTNTVTVNAGGTLGGTGTIGGAVSLIGGTLSPGTSSGTLTVGTDEAWTSVTMDADATYKWEFDGSIGDLVVIKGDLSLVEGWNLALADVGGVPAPGSTYDLFTYTGSGPGSIMADIIATPAGWPSFTIAQGTGRVYLKFGSPGDANEDGVIDAADYITLKKNFGKTSGAVLADGDFNSSGTVNWADLNILTSNIGSGSGAPATAPEPGSAMLLVFGAAALLRRRRK